MITFNLNNMDYFLLANPELLAMHILFAINFIIILIRNRFEKKKLIILNIILGFIYSFLIMHSSQLEILKYIKEMAILINAYFMGYSFLDNSKEELLNEKKIKINEIEFKKNIHLFLNQLIKIHLLAMQQHIKVQSFICINLNEELNRMPSFSIPVESDIFKLLLHPDVSSYMTLYWNTEGFLKDISLNQSFDQVKSSKTIIIFPDFQTKTFTIIFEKELKYLSAGQTVNIIEQILMTKK